jgi:periplasmic divalent cation tolerance protein
LYCTVPDPETARSISDTLVNERLAACCNIVPEMTSVYRWKNKVEVDSELLLIIKSRSSLFPQIEKRIKNLHPYSVPEIIALPIKNGSVEYLKWMDKNVKT